MNTGGAEINVREKKQNTTAERGGGGHLCVDEMRGKEGRSKIN